MQNTRIEQFDKAAGMRKESADALMDYWLQHNIYESFEFWLLVALFLFPLVLLAFKIDKRHIFMVGFFGFSVHVLSLYMNVVGINKGFWNFPIPVLPFLPAVAFDASLVPITYMLVFQWTNNNKKNYYLFAIITSMFFAVILEPILLQMEIFKLYGNINYIHRLIGYISISFIAKLLTNLLLLIHEKSKINHQ